jgi:hypothetical protein
MVRAWASSGSMWRISRMPVSVCSLSAAPISLAARWGRPTMAAWQASPSSRYSRLSAEIDPASAADSAAPAGAVLLLESTWYAGELRLTHSC